VIFIGEENIVVQGQPVVSVEDVIASDEDDIAPIMDRLAALEQSVIGPNTQYVAESQEITILADRSTPFNVIKRVMSTCTNQGYGRISLAVITKGAAAAQVDQIARS